MVGDVIGIGGNGRNRYNFEAPLAVLFAIPSDEMFTARKCARGGGPRLQVLRTEGAAWREECLAPVLFLGRQNTAFQ
jgi:hypothetical protein